MTDLQGAIGLEQLKQLDKFIEERAKWAKWYTKELADIEWIKTPFVLEGNTHSWQSFVLYVDPSNTPVPRNNLMKSLQVSGISTRPGTHAVHMLKFYKKKYKINPSDFPIAKLCELNSIAIPLHNKMSKEDYDYVVTNIKLSSC